MSVSTFIFVHQCNLFYHIQLLWHHTFKLEKGEYGLSHETVKEVLERLMTRRFRGARGAEYDKTNCIGEQK
jgi:hypothetical protein